MKKLLFCLCIFTSVDTIGQDIDSSWIVNNYTKKEVYISMRDGKKLFSINESPSPSSEEKFPFPELLETIAIIVLLISFLFCGRLLLYRSLAAGVIFSFIIIAARIGMIVFHVPEPLYQTALFSPTYYASSFFFNSPGDLLLNVLTILIVILIFYRHRQVINLYDSFKVSSTNAAAYFFSWC